MQIEVAFWVYGSYFFWGLGVQPLGSEPHTNPKTHQKNVTFAGVFTQTQPPQPPVFLKKGAVIYYEWMIFAPAAHAGCGR